MAVKNFQEIKNEAVSVRLYPSEKSNGYYGSFTFHTAIGDIAVRVNVKTGRKGVFLSFPSYRKSDGKYVQTAYPCSLEALETLESLAEACINQF